jgi:D-3-phosphoglycerate dehydrogenase / 2-oxoglutarate reductase
MDKFTVVVTDDRFGTYREEENVLGPVGARVVVRNLGSEEEAIRELAQADAILLNLFPLTARVISKLERCKVISRYGIGYDNVDVEEATRRGIWVSRVPDYCIEETSDQALGLLLAAARRIAYKDREIRKGRWNLHKEMHTGRIAGKTLGIVGYGAIGRKVHRKVAGLGFARVLVSDPYVDPALIEIAGAHPVDPRILYRESDFITLHVPLTKETRGMISAREIGTMKKNAIIINTSRGPVVDEAALVAALKEGRIAGAGLDVFDHEPLPAGSVLFGMDTVVLSDHASWYSEEAEVELKTKAARNVAAVLCGEKPHYPVNSI